MKKIILVLLVLFLAACFLLEDPPAQDTPRPTTSRTPAPSSTPTVVWFPPTDTPAATPTREITPTPGLMVELGEILYQDPFLSNESWSLPQNERGQINIGNGELNIIINEPDSYFAGIIEKPDLSEYYAEITANPVLCSGRDEYGFLFSVYGTNQYYRFALSCSGEVRLDRLSASGITVLYPWTRNASVPPGAPSVTKLAVLVVDGEIHLFLNGESPYSITGQGNTFGSFGVYARSVGETALTVSFRDFIIREVLPK